MGFLQYSAVSVINIEQVSTPGNIKHYCFTYGAVDTQSKLNVHKTFIWGPERHMNSIL